MSGWVHFRLGAQNGSAREEAGCRRAVAGGKPDVLDILPLSKPAFLSSVIKELESSYIEGDI